VFSISLNEICRDLDHIPESFQCDKVEFRVRPLRSKLRISMRRLFLLAIIFWQGCFFAASAEAAQRIALIFGNGDYQNAPRLPNPVNDATDVAAAFGRLGFSVQLIKNGTFDAMRRGLLSFAQQAPSAEIVVVYFAGHGMEIRDENWLIPVDAELRMDFSAGQEAISLGSIIPIASKAQKLGLVILDACRDNPFSKQIQMSQPGRALPTRGLVQIEPPNSVLVVFAAKHGTTAADGAGRNSPFTTALLQNLETPGLEINYLFRNVHDEVYRATEQRQEPYVYGTLSKQPVYLKPTIDPASKAERPSSPSEVALAWSAVKDTRDPVDLEAFLGQFGDNAFYSALARNRLNQLNKVQPVATALPPKPSEQDPKPNAAPNLQPDRQADSMGILGPWSWRSECPIFGSFRGTLKFTQFENERLTGSILDNKVGDWWPLFDAHMSNASISFGMSPRKGETQHWKGTLTRNGNGQSVLKGTATDSIFSGGHCTWVATKD
jgi:hypothetical protein